MKKSFFIKRQFFFFVKRHFLVERQKKISRASLINLRIMYDLPELRKPYFSKVQLCRHPAVNRIHRVYLLYFWRVQYICRREQLIWMRYYFDIKRKNLQQHTWYVYTWNFCPIKSFIVSKYGVVLARLRIVRKFI